MRITLNLLLFSFVLCTFSNKSFSLTNYQIEKFCKKEKRESITCIKLMKEKRFNLNKGNLIEIPVEPYKR